LTIKFAVAAGLFIAAQISIIAAALILFAMIGSVNSKLSEADQISCFGAHPLMYREIFQKYRQLYPDGRYIRYFLACVYLGVGLLIASAWRIGLF